MSCGTVETKLGHGEGIFARDFGGKNNFAGRDIENKGIDMDCAMAPICFS